MHRRFHIISRFPAVAALFAILIVSAQAQDSSASLVQASKLIEQGQPELSIELIDKTLKSGNVPADLAAKAMLMRAQAQEKLGKHAYALADYNSALWMQDLTARDRARAEAARMRIMAKLGVADAIPATAKASSQSKTVNASSGTEVRTEISEKRTAGSGGSLFEGVFGSSNAATSERLVEPEADAPLQAPARPVRVAQAVEQPNGQRYSNVVTVNDTGSSSNLSSVQGDLTGNFAIQFSSVRSEDNALYEVDRIEKRYKEWLGGRQPSIKVRGTQDGGTLYKIIAAPYERGEGVATCELLKTKGVSCMLISR